MVEWKIGSSANGFTKSAALQRELYKVQPLMHGTAVLGKAVKTLVHGLFTLSEGSMRMWFTHGDTHIYIYIYICIFHGHIYIHMYIYTHTRPCRMATPDWRSNVLPA